MRPGAWFVAMLLVGLVCSSASADPGARVRSRSVAEAATVAATRRLPSSLLTLAGRRPTAGPTRQARGALADLQVPVNSFGLGLGNPIQVSVREAFRVGVEANQATWALGFLPRQPELRDSLVGIFKRLADDTAELEASEGYRGLAALASSGEAPAVLLTRHRELMEEVSRDLESLGGNRRWHFDLGYNAQQLRLVLFFQRRGMVGQGMAAMRLLAGMTSPASLDPGLRRRLEELTSLPAPQDLQTDRAVQGQVEELLAWL